MLLGTKVEEKPTEDVERVCVCVCVGGREGGCWGCWVPSSFHIIRLIRSAFTVTFITKYLKVFSFGSLTKFVSILNLFSALFKKLFRSWLDMTPSLIPTRTSDRIISWTWNSAEVLISVPGSDLMSLKLMNVGSLLFPFTDFYVYVCQIYGISNHSKQPLTSSVTEKQSLWENKILYKKTVTPQLKTHQEWKQNIITTRDWCLYKLLQLNMKGKYRQKPRTIKGQKIESRDTLAANKTMMILIMNRWCKKSLLCNHHGYKI